LDNIFPNSMDKTRGDILGDGVDVVIRTKDRPVLLKRAIGSVLGQSHENWHIYLINDGGATDVLEEVLAPFQDRIRSDRLTIVHHPSSLGTSTAANKGTRIGHNPFVAIHDDDDTWDPAFLSTAASLLLKPENHRFGGFVSKWNQVEEIITGVQVIKIGSTEKGYDGGALDFLDVLRKAEIPPIALVLRRNVYERVGFFNEELPVIEDWDLTIRALQVADLALSPEALANHHIRRQDAASYNNTITKSLDTHHLYNTLYRNALIRDGVNSNNDSIGFLIGLLRDNERSRKNLSDLVIASHQGLAGKQQSFGERLDKIEADVNHIKNLLERSMQYTSKSQCAPLLPFRECQAPLDLEGSGASNRAT
jgi:glycosyltransferase involved in cell wall biosynthesis